MASLRFERWVSNENQEEIHYFIGNEYLFGYNPKFVDEQAIIDLLRSYNERRSTVS